MCFFFVHILYVQGCCLARVFLPEVEYHCEIHVFPTSLISLFHSPPWSLCSSIVRDWALWLYFPLISSGIYDRKAESRTVLQIIFEGCYLLRYGAVYFGKWVPRIHRHNKMRTLPCIETSGSDCPVTRRHFPEERNRLRLFHFEDFKTHCVKIIDFMLIWRS